MSSKKTAAKAWRAYLLLAAVLAGLCTVIALASFQYYHKLQATVKAESGDYLQEISKQIAANAGKTIEDNFAILGTVATVLKNSEITSFSQLGKIVQDQREHWRFENILLVDAAGVGYNKGGKAVLMGNEPYLREAIVEGERAISVSQLLGGKECIAFAIPLSGLQVEGTEMSALVATFELASFDRLLSITAFNGKCYGHIIRRDGTVVIRSSSPNAPETGYNILASLEDAPFTGPTGGKTVVRDIADGRSGQAELTLNGVPMCMAYTPLAAREWCLLTMVPLAVATEKSALFLNSTLLIGGLLALVFSVLLGMLLLSNYYHKRKLEQLAYVDTVTGGNTIQRFYVQAEALLDVSNPPQYALIYTNIDKFKILNEQLGRNMCDTMLRATCRSIQRNLSSHECMGRLFADNFCVLMKYTDEENLAQRLGLWKENYLQILQETGGAWISLTMEVGVYVLEDTILPLQDMIDRAKLALRETPRKQNAQQHYTIYDEQVRRRILREKHLEDKMARALENHDFQVYLQPKYRTDNEKIGGAEALVRWQCPVEGMIYPDEFISLFEKNGFIVRLDLWVFEQVCQTLSRWLGGGNTPVRISVNCSRVHLRTPDFLEQYRVIARRYQIPPELLEIELTETVVFEDVAALTKIIGEIHASGFACSMDDFGSGYSSLKLIQDIPVDVLKLDRVFFTSAARDFSRMESVVGSILTMARALSMQTVAEGVEERAQVDMLKRLGCDYIQGYYFAKPMPIADFEKLAFG